MKNSLLRMAEMQSEPIDPHGIVTLLGTSLLLGSILMVIAVWTALSVSPSGKKNAAPVVSPWRERIKDVLISSSNVLFLCFGVTAVMILVNNDLARAFAIGAVIAMIRFRVKMDGTGSASMLFAVIVGMACGVNQTLIAIGVTGVFTLAQALLLGVANLFPASSPGASKD